MIEDAEEKGAIGPGQTILEPTSGNTGISLAMICRRKGYPLKVVMPDNVTPGAHPAAEDVRRGDRLLAGRPGLQRRGRDGAGDGRGRPVATTCPTSTATRPTRDAHYNGTAVEILDELDGEVDAFVAGLGTGGTLMGNGRRFKEELGDA